MNLCASCGDDFSSVSQFDAHGTGRHGYTLSEGLAMNPKREDGRRCLSPDEMESKGWKRNQWKRWSDPRSIEAVRAAFSASQSRREATEPAGEVSERVDTAA